MNRLRDQHPEVSRTDRPNVLTIPAEKALRGNKWAVVFDFGGHYEVDDVFMTRAVAENAARRLNSHGTSPGGTEYEVARIEF